jgi:hypothetical protein
MGCPQNHSGHPGAEGRMTRTHEKSDETAAEKRRLDQVLEEGLKQTFPARMRSV